MSLYDKIAHLYDPWSLSVVEDIEFYVELARESGGPVVELAVGTGRVAVPIAAAVAGVELDLRHGDLREPPIAGTYPLVVIAFRSLLHMETDSDRRAALRAVRRLLAPGGRFVFDVFAPAPDDIEETHGRWFEREEGIFERADWDEATRTLVLNVRGPGAEVALSLAWLSVAEWRVLLAEEGFVVEELFGWFDRTPWNGHEDSIWICRRGD